MFIVGHVSRAGVHFVNALLFDAIVRVLHATPCTVPQTTVSYVAYSLILRVPHAPDQYAKRMFTNNTIHTWIRY